MAADVRIGDSTATDVGERIVAALGESAARELLEVLERSDADRARMIGRLHVRDDATRHAPACDHRDVTDPAFIRATLRVQEREGYWWVECSMCACCWQTPYLAAESVG